MISVVELHVLEGLAVGLGGGLFLFLHTYSTI